jgi:hypothetical protein
LREVLYNMSAYCAKCSAKRAPIARNALQNERLLRKENTSVLDAN